MRIRVCFGHVAGLLLLLALGAPAHATDPAVLLAQLQALPGVDSVVPAASSIPDTQFFQITFVQPVDHDNPGAGSFLQRATLLHRDESLPMVLVTEGYATSMTLRQSELAYYLQANQLRIEHRFFLPSGPDPLEWSLLDIEQAADDHHSIVKSFKLLYDAKWVSTGASKSGMASIYFRYFYPNDVDATVPYVAPSSHRTSDPRYVRFLSLVGPADCRARMTQFQQRALVRRDSLLAMIPDDGYEVIGLDRALEFAILETPFAFWQYQDETACAGIPDALASDEELLDFIDAVVGVSFYSDSVLDYYAPYFYQSATQLGAPRIDENNLDHLLRYPGQDIPQNYPPINVPKIFDLSAMLRIEGWVRWSGQRFIFIYGENDPWSTNAFRVTQANDSHRVFVRGLEGNHGANITTLSEADRELVLTKLAKWLDVSPPVGGFAALRAADPHGFDKPTRGELFLK